MSRRITTRITEEIDNLFSLKREEFDKLLKRGLSVVIAF